MRQCRALVVYVTEPDLRFICHAFLNSLPFQRAGEANGGALMSPPLRRKAMESPFNYSNICKLKNGMRLLIRSLNNGDHEEFAKFIQQTPEEILQFCKLNIKDQDVVDSWLDPTKAHRGIPLIALDLVTKKPIGCIYLEKGQCPALRFGEIQQVLVAEHLQGLGVGSLLLDSVI
jgi:hypothetical protein